MRVRRNGAERSRSRQRRFQRPITRAPINSLTASSVSNAGSLPPHRVEAISIGAGSVMGVAMAPRKRVRTTRNGTGIVSGVVRRAPRRWSRRAVRPRHPSDRPRPRTFTKSSQRVRFSGRILSIGRRGRRHMTPSIRRGRPALPEVAAGWQQSTLCFGENRFQIVAVGVQDESCKVSFFILRSEARCSVVFASIFQGLGVKV
jgi:hypothetical protein